MSETLIAATSEFSTLFPAGAALERVATGFVWAEGGVWVPGANELRFSDIPNNRIMAWSPETGLRTFRQPSQRTNGHTLDLSGAMVSCEHGGRCVSRTTADGTYEVLATHWQGKRLNSPNDVVVKSDGSIWFTDPPYGILTDYEGHKAEIEQDGCHVYRIDGESGVLTIVADDFVKPNGLAFSPDERILYIADTGASHDPVHGPRHIRACDVSADGTRLTGSRVFATCTAGLFDGFRLDVEIDFDTPAIGRQRKIFELDPQAYAREIAELSRQGQALAGARWSIRLRYRALRLARHHRKLRRAQQKGPENRP